MRTHLFLCAALAAVGSLTAQTTRTIVPSGAVESDPAYYDYYNFSGTPSTTVKHESRTQYLYDSADVGGAGAWRRLSLRRPFLYAVTQPATTFSSTVIMSNSPVAYDAPSTVFTMNHGSSSAGTAPQTVFSGTISLPASSRGTRWPEPWLPVVAFHTVFVHAPVKGGSLVVEFINSNNNQNRTYYVEGFQPDGGARAPNGPSGGCMWTSEGASYWNNGIGYRSPVVGGTWYVRHRGMPSNEPNLKRSLNIIGVQGAGGMAFGRTLPIPIASLGFPDVCKNSAGKLFTDFVFAQPMIYTPSTGGPGLGVLTSPTVPVPNDPGLGGAVFFQQPFCTDKPLNGHDQIYMGWSSKWTIGTGTGLPGSMIYRLFDNKNPAGSSRPGCGQTCMFQ